MMMMRYIMMKCGRLCPSGDDDDVRVKYDLLPKQVVMMMKCFSGGALQRKSDQFEQCDWRPGTLNNIKCHLHHDNTYILKAKKFAEPLFQ